MESKKLPHTKLLLVAAQMEKAGQLTESQKDILKGRWEICFHFLAKILDNDEDLYPIVNSFTETNDEP